MSRDESRGDEIDLSVHGGGVKKGKAQLLPWHDAAAQSARLVQILFLASAEA